MFITPWPTLKQKRVWVSGDSSEMTLNQRGNERGQRHGPNRALGLGHFSYRLEFVPRHGPVNTDSRIRFALVLQENKIAATQLQNLTFTKPTPRG
jgi:hypothetical protein